MTTQEVLDAWGISRPTLYRRIKEGVITPLPKKPGLKRAYPLLFRRSEIEKIQEQNEAD